MYLPWFMKVNWVFFFFVPGSLIFKHHVLYRVATRVEENYKYKSSLQLEIRYIMSSQIKGGIFTMSPEDHWPSTAKRFRPKIHWYLIKHQIRERSSFRILISLKLQLIDHPILLRSSSFLHVRDGSAERHFSFCFAITSHFPNIHCLFVR